MNAPSFMFQKNNGKEMAKKIYISLPIAHYDLEERKEYAKKVEATLKHYYGEVVNPFDNGVPDNADWTVHMRKDLQMLLGCDEIFMCSGWERSKGCKLEHDVATSCGLDVRYENPNFVHTTLTEQVTLLKEISVIYGGRTINNIITQIESRIKEATK